MLAKRFDQKGKVIILSETTDEPLTLAGGLAGICWRADTKDNKKNFNRGLDCLHSGHWRTLEFPQIYMVLDGWSAKVIRELYTHIGGSPSRLQSSTRYVDYTNFAYTIPPKIENNPEALDAFEGTMDEIRMTADYLENSLGVPREDSSMVLPLTMATKIVLRTNLRHLIDIAKVRMCSRAYWEFRDLMDEIINALKIYSDEWKYLIEEEHIFQPKCEWSGYCDETKSCGRKIKKSDFQQFIDMADYYHKQGYDGKKIKEFILEE